jgi:hypothetical protein
MNLSEVDQARKVVLEKIQADHVSNPSNPALTPAEQTELTALQAEVK